jgi:hypothetical protein
MFLHLCFDIALRFTYIEALAIFINFTRNFVKRTGGSACVVPSIRALPVDLKSLRAIAWTLAEVSVNNTPEEFSSKVTK